MMLGVVSCWFVLVISCDLSVFDLVMPGWPKIQAKLGMEGTYLRPPHPENFSLPGAK